jgi:hypothetical protein
MFYSGILLMQFYVKNFINFTKAAPIKVSIDV